MNWLSRFMFGRYGSDQLSFAMLAIYIFLYIIARIFALPVLAVIAMVLPALSCFRMLSRNISARRAENERFLRIWYPISSYLRELWLRIRTFRTYKYFRCPTCKKLLRVPRGRGKVKVACTRCGNHFIKKT